MQKKDARSLPSEKILERRKRVISTYTQLDNISETARVCGVSRSMVYKCLRIYRTQHDLLLERRGRKENTPIPASLRGKIIDLIETSLPFEWGLKYKLWSVRSVRILLKKEFDIDLSSASINRLLKEWRFMPKILQNKNWHQFRSKETANLTLKEFAKAESRQLYYMGVAARPENFIYATTPKNQFKFSVAETSAFLFLNNLLREAKRDLVVAYQSKSLSKEDFSETLTPVRHFDSTNFRRLDRERLAYGTNNDFRVLTDRIKLVIITLGYCPPYNAPNQIKEIPRL